MSEVDAGAAGADLATALQHRLLRFRGRLKELNHPAALVTEPLNVSYLSGFTGSTAALLVTGDRAVFITDSRYSQQAATECPYFEIVTTAAGKSYDETIGEELSRLRPGRIAFEADDVTVWRLRELEKQAGDTTLEPVGDLVRPLRMKKDGVEIAAIRQACALVDAAFDEMLPSIRPGRSELEIAIELEFILRRAGSGPLPFEMIVASGWRSSLPHGRASSRVIQSGDLCTLDFGASVSGYASDITRTVVAGAASDRQREIYEIVSRALQAGKDAIRPGATGREVDETARAIIRDAGFGSNFGHGLGHGLGLHVHDHPGFSSRSDVTLEAGMVLTVEPGIYIDGWGGVRIEDDVLVTEQGVEVLTHCRRDLIELV